MVTRTAAALAAALLLAGCKKDEAPPAAVRVEERGEAASLVRRSPPQLNGGLRAPEFLICRDAESFAKTWARANAHHATVPAPPKVDFAKEMAAFAALGEKPTGGWRIEIVGVRRDGGKLVVLYAIRSPAEGEFVPQSLTQPWDLVYLPADAAAPEWAKYEAPKPPPTKEGK
jgi:hypothetical protein